MGNEMLSLLTGAANHGVAAMILRLPDMSKEKNPFP